MTHNYNDIRKQSKIFLEIYKDRPFKELNMGGMLLPHLFATWYMLRKLNPDIIIESGTFQGLGTWVMEQACPTAQIVSIDIRDQRKYISDKVKYLDSDITEYEWPPENTLKKVIHFDDHQNAVERVKWAKKQGFKHLIFEDNYPEDVGDCVSLKQHKRFRDKHGIYQEFPPMFARDTTRWQDRWDKYDTLPPIYKEKDINNPYYKQAKSYTWICYYQLKN